MRSIFFAPLALFCASASEERVRVRLLHVPTDAVSTAMVPAASSSSRQQAPTAFRVPYKASGPPALLGLRGRCFFVDVAGVKSYEYGICPFANVTQRETGGTWNAFYGLLGLWDDWVSPQSGAAVIRGRFSDGTDCSGTRRVAVVSFTCSGPAGVYAIKGIAEPKTCEYEFTFACPEACGVDAETVRPRGLDELPLDPTPTASATPSSADVSSFPTPSSSTPIPPPSPSVSVPLTSLSLSLPLAGQDTAALIHRLESELRTMTDALAGMNKTLAEVRATLGREGSRNNSENSTQAQIEAVFEAPVASASAKKRKRDVS